MFTSFGSEITKGSTDLYYTRHNKDRQKFPFLCFVPYKYSLRTNCETGVQSDTLYSDVYR
jgi:hypothetical protein